MKKLCVLLFLVLSGFLYGQERMKFEDISFSLEQYEFENQLSEKGWAWTEDYCYKGVWLDKERELRLEWNMSDLISLTLLYKNESEFAILSDFYNILDHYKKLPMWKITDYYWIIYDGQNEIVIQKTTRETTVRFIDTKNELQR